MKKYPRTPHFPESPGGTRDDRRLESLASFVGREIVLTEKMDGSNVCLESNGCFARSHGHTPTHPSFSGLKALHAAVRARIPPSFQIFGEWLYAKHSIHYQELTSYLQIFAVRDLGLDLWLSWKTVEAWASSLGTFTVPVICRFTAKTEAELRSLIAAQAAALGPDREGLVARWEAAFKDALFDQAVGKWVRAGHITSSEHWKSQVIVRNGLRTPSG